MTEEVTARGPKYRKRFSQRIRRQQDSGEESQEQTVCGARHRDGTIYKCEGRYQALQGSRQGDRRSPPPPQLGALPFFRGCSEYRFVVPPSGGTGIQKVTKDSREITVPPEGGTTKRYSERPLKNVRP